MILLLLLLTACHVVQAEFKPCPADSACLYHARCIDAPEQHVTTTEPKGFMSWWSAHTKSCKSGSVSQTELFIRPLLTNKWNLTVESTHNDTGISFGDSLIIMANETETSLKIGSDAPIKIPFEQNDTVISLMIDSPHKLYKIFHKLEIVYFDDESITEGSKEQVFWKKVAELTPCNASLIIDDCSAAKNCTKLSVTPKAVECPEGSMWLKQENSTWLMLKSVFCDDLTDWITENAGDPLPEPKEGMEIRCAVDEPEPWTASLTGRTPKKEIVDEKEKAEGKAEFALMNSPFTWVGIGVVGIIALAAVALAIVYAHRKLGKNPAASKSGTKVGFHQVPQDPQVSQTGASNSNSEADLPKADKPLLTPAPGAPDADVTRADAPTADTVNRLSMIKTIRDESNIGTPIPPPLSI